MCSKPLYNLFLIFFWQRSFLYTLTARFMILCAHRAQLCRKIRLFCCISLFLRNYLFRMRLFGRLVGGMAGLRRTVPVFSRRNGYTAPLQTVCGVCGGGCVFGGLHARQRDAVPPLQRGVGLLQICHSLFCPPCPAPDSRFPIADFYLRQLPAFKLSCVNCNPSRAILCGTYLII